MTRERLGFRPLLFVRLLLGVPEIVVDWYRSR